MFLIRSRIQNDTKAARRKRHRATTPYSPFVKGDFEGVVVEELTTKPTQAAFEGDFV